MLYARRTQRITADRLLQPHTDSLQLQNFPHAEGLRECRESLEDVGEVKHWERDK